MRVPLVDPEGARHDAMRQYRLLEMTPARAAQDFTALASAICGVPLALMTPEGVASGVWVALDHHPLSLTPAQQAALAILARQAATYVAWQRVAVALADVVAKSKILPGIVPICMYCKGLRDEQGCWRQLEDYLDAHTDTAVSHGMCPTCLQTHHPALAAPQG